MNAPSAIAAQPVPPRAGAAHLVLSVADDPDSSVTDLARAVGGDPALTARVLALANSAYYGLSGRVGTTDFAVSLVGFDTVRALALTVAAGLDRPGVVPDGFWRQATLSAAAAGLCAPMFDAPAGDAFVLGLLHTVGSALLHQQHPVSGLCLPYPDDVGEFERDELERYGTTHSQAAAELLAGWRFPPVLCRLIAEHHNELLLEAAPLARVLRVARILTDRTLVDRGPSSSFDADLARVSEGRLSVCGVQPLLDQLAAKASSLYDGIAGTPAAG